MEYLSETRLTYSDMRMADSVALRPKIVHRLLKAPVKSMKTWTALKPA